MSLKLAIAALLVGTVAGCAYPGHAGLLKDAHQKQYTYDGSAQVLADCLTEKFNNEPFGMMDINTPVTTSLSRKNGLQLISSINNVWAWSLQLVPLDTGVSIEAEVRKSVNPYLSDGYMLDKVERYLSQCGAAGSFAKV